MTDIEFFIIRELSLFQFVKSPSLEGNLVKVARINLTYKSNINNTIQLSRWKQFQSAQIEDISQNAAQIAYKLQKS